MASDPLPHDAVGWATLGGGLAMVLGTIGAGLAGLRQRFTRSLTGLKNDMLERDREIGRRVSDLAAGQLREREIVRNLLAMHEQKDDSRFAELHARLNIIRDDMARRDDLGRVEDKIDQLLLIRQRRNGAS